ncbi:MAG: hypothetical protein QOG71_222 [Pyrinomonadaceae bacterium]|nr:hypothetical protein [Pyrinomonadaceae bacterium]
MQTFERGGGLPRYENGSETRSRKNCFDAASSLSKRRGKCWNTCLSYTYFPKTGENQMRAEITTTAITNTTPRFLLGKMVMTQGAAAALDEAGQSPFEFLNRHQRGDWGEVCDEDRQENQLSLRKGFRLLSVYHTKRGVKLYVITEWDRSVTTLLLSEDY